MKNIEVKVSISNFNHITKALKKMGAEFTGTLYQIDTYYRSPVGRLKVREIDNDTFQLVYYERPNRRSSRVSDYKLIDILPEQAPDVKHVLGKTFGERAIVVKRRRLWLFRNTRIHLDMVKGLGNFLELETAVKEGRLDAARREYNEISRSLGLARFEKLGGSYSDLLLYKQKEDSNTDK